MRRFDKIWNNKILVGNALCLWVICVCLLPNVMMLADGFKPLAVRIANIMIPACIYLGAITRIKKCWLAVVVMFPVLFLSAFQLVLDYLYGSSLISVDMWLNLATTNSSEVKELLDSLVIAIILISLLYLAPVGFGIVSFLRDWTIGESVTKPFAYISLCCGVAGVSCLGIAASEQTYNVGKEIFPINAVINLSKAIERQKQVTGYESTSSGFTFDATCQDSCDNRQVHIIVVGETSRADNWSLFGYHRNTTPEIDKIRGIIGFNKTLSESNTTHKSVPLLISHLDGRTFGDSIFRVKSIITAFKEAGYSTAYFSNQQRNKSYIDFFGEEADNCVFINDGQDDDIKTKDSQLLKLIDAEMGKGNPKQLIVLHLYGSHFNYLDRYTGNSRVFIPDSYKEAGRLHRRELMNAYDNSIVETGRFLHEITKRLSGNNINATMLFTSDHGEDIFDDERNRFLHASPTPTYYQLHVPFIVWMSDSYMTQNPEKLNAGRENAGKPVSSSASFFHTALNLANIRCRVYDESRSVVSDKYKPLDPGFLDDHNEFLSLENSGLSSLDFDKLEESGIYISRCK